MIEGLMGLLVLLLVLAVVFWICKVGAEWMGAPPVVLQVLGAILLLILVLAALRVVGVPLPAWK